MAQTHLWSLWKRGRMDKNGMTAPNNYAENAALKQRFVRVMGGPLGTGGRGAVALRCDHGLANFRDRVLPLTVARRISVSQAYNPRNWHYPENAGVTIEELDDWVADGRVEIWNHSASHASAESAAQLRDQIVGGLQEIQEQLPAARGKVWGWRSEEHTSELQSRFDLVCRLLLEK